MHIENDKLVGSYVSEVYPENGAVTIIIIDGDSTPTREFTRYKYVQTPQLTELGIAVKDYGCVIIPNDVINMITNNEIDGEDFGVIVNFNGVEYGISISDILALAPNDAIEFSAVDEDTFIGAIFGAEIPPFNSENTDSILKVVDDKLQWVKVEEPETYYISALVSGDFVVCYPNTTTPVPYNKFDRGLPIRQTNNGEETTILYPCAVIGSFTYASPADSSGEIHVEGYIGDIVNNIVKRDNYANIKCVPSFGTTDKYKVLSVNSSGNGLVWKTLTKELPTIAAGDAGKVLKVNSGETGVEWGAAGGTQLYTHRITLGKPSVTQNFTLTVISTDATAYNESGFISYLINHGAINGAKALPVNANCSYLSHLTNNVKFITGVYVDSSLIYGVTHNISVSNGEIVDSQANATLNFVEDVCEAL